MKGRMVAALVVAVLVGPARWLLSQGMAMTPMTPAALFIVAVGLSMFVWWLGVLWDREHERVR